MAQVPRLVRTNHAVRTAAFAYAFFALALHLWQRGAGPTALALLALQFLVYPHLVYWRAARSAHPTRAELDNLFVDAALLGAWIAWLGFPTWIAYGLLAATTLNATVNRGMQGALVSLACSGAGAALAVAVGGFRYWPGTSELVSALAFFGILVYTTAVGWVVYQQNRRIVHGRRELAASEARYRLIAENVGDLVAIVDRDSRWIYASPSHARVLPEAALEPGTDAFARLHADDADRARATVLRVATSGGARELPVRLADREGRLRRYRMRVQALPGDPVPRTRLLLVSREADEPPGGEPVAVPQPP